LVFGFLQILQQAVRSNAGGKLLDAAGAVSLAHVGGAGDKFRERQILEWSWLNSCWLKEREEAHLSALMSYRVAAGVLQHLLPIDAAVRRASQNGASPPHGAAKAHPEG
jgi:hypothetical protein